MAQCLVHGSFGIITQGRYWTSGSGEEYRFGFNGKENIDEIYENKNAVDFGARIYDSRLGRWFGVDPLFNKHPDLSVYSSFNNNPILYIDPDGRDFYLNVNTTLAMADIRGLIEESSQDNILFTEVQPGLFKVEFSLEGGVINNDAGVQLLINLCTATETYLYTVSNSTQYIAKRSTGDELVPYDMTSDPMVGGEKYAEADGVANWSETAEELKSDDYDASIGGKSKRVPVDQFGLDINGNVFLAETGSWVHPDKTPYSRSEMAFHELWENFERTTNKLPYAYPSDMNEKSAQEDRDEWVGAHEMSRRAQTGRNPSGYSFVHTRDRNPAVAGVALYIEE